MYLKWVVLVTQLLYNLPFCMRQLTRLANASTCATLTTETNSHENTHLYARIQHKQQKSHNNK